MIKTLKNEIRKVDSLTALNELSSFINDCKVMLGRATFKIGDEVYVVQKTKKTPGTITKINVKKCLVDMNGRSYRVPMAMLELRN